MKFQEKPSAKIGARFIAENSIFRHTSCVPP